MAVNFGIPFGPTGGPGTFVTGFSFFDDFIGSSYDTTPDAAKWDIAGTTAGSVPITAVDEPYGVVSLVPEASGDESVLELNGEPIQMLREQDAVFEIRMKVSSIATNTANWFVGISQEALDMESGSAGAFESNAIGFAAQADANIDAICGDGTSETIDDTTSNLVAATYVVLTWKWHAKTKQIRYYVDGVKKVTQSVADGDTIPAEGTNMTITLYSEGMNGTGVIIDIDYVLFAQSR